MKRFWGKVNKTEDCWLWTAYTEDGYGRFRLDGKMHLAHRLVYEMEIGPIPEGLQIDHLCRVRHCVNPQHLEPVTQLENVRRGDQGVWQKVKTHCPQGHVYDDLNTWVDESSPYRRRHCRACNRDRTKARYARLKGVAYAN